MEKRRHLYVSRKDPALWLMALLMLASVAARIIIFPHVAEAGVWRQTVAVCHELHWCSLFLRQLHGLAVAFF